MIIRMENAEGLSLLQMAALLGTSQEVRFAAKGKQEVYEWAERVPVRQEYALQGRKTKGVVRAYLAKMTGKSLPQITPFARRHNTAAVCNLMQQEIERGGSLAASRRHLVPHLLNPTTWALIVQKLRPPEI